MVKEMLIFAGGAFLGSACTYLLVKKIYRDKAEAEISEVRNIYYEKCRRVDNIHKNEDYKKQIINFDNEDLDESNKIIENNGYNYEKPEDDDSLDIPTEEDIDEEWEREHIAPSENSSDRYTITPHQFAFENRHYDKITLLYYPADKILVNELTDNEEAVDITIGEDALTKFGEFEEDVVYVRNDRIGIDYEVILQPISSHYYISEDELN